MEVLTMLNLAIKLAISAGNVVMKVYKTDFGVDVKEDKSPLTIADKYSHNIITKGLLANYPTIPILSEEGKNIPFEERERWKTFWLIDPLDGTKEFINRNGEFTINIALIKDSRPVLGVIYAPSLDLLYFAEKGKGAYKLTSASTSQNPISDASKLTQSNQNETLTVLASRSHLTDATKQFITNLEKIKGKSKLISVGSSLKFCYVAEGLADIYPRLSPTMEWDTGAGQMIIEETGGFVLTETDKMHLFYNKPSLINPSFLVYNASFKD
jgi:3'(2'), 5'-bisphosphate nucleotidase